MAGNSDLVDLTLDKKHETAKALLLTDGKHEAWAPKRIIEDNGDGTYTMPEWIAKEKGWI